MIGSMPRSWTEAETRKLVELRARGKTYREVAKALGRTRLSINMRIVKLNHDARLERDFDRLLDSMPSTRVDAEPAVGIVVSSIPSRVRAPERSWVVYPPSVIEVPLDEVERTKDAGLQLATEMVESVSRGWTFAWADVDATRAAAIACSRASATIRGDRFEVHEDVSGRPAIVSIGRPGHVARSFVLVVVRYSRSA